MMGVANREDAYILIVRGEDEVQALWCVIACGICGKSLFSSAETMKFHFFALPRFFENLEPTSLAAPMSHLKGMLLVCAKLSCDRLKTSPSSWLPLV
jgi:hypothetical protein